MALDDDWAAAVENHIQSLRVTAPQAAVPAPVQAAPMQPVQQVPVQQAAPSTMTALPNNGMAPSAPAVQAQGDQATDLAEESLLSKILAQKLHEVSTTAKLEVQQRDPTSPLFSAKNWSDLTLSEELNRGLRDMGFLKPSRIQETALPILLRNPPENMIAQSQSGTGKTAAFSLTVLSRIDINIKEPQALILSPTYELALQTGLVVDKMGQYLQLDERIAYAVKGNRITRGTKITQPIIIGTPGSVGDWMTRHRAFDPKKIKILVLDEADIMIATQGHKDQTIKIKRSLDQNICQSLLFSATYDDRILKFAKSIIKNPNILTLRREDETLDNIKQYFVKAENDDRKLHALFNIYAILGAGQAVVFCKKKITAKQVAIAMNAQGFAVALLSGDLTVEERAMCIRRFQQGLEKVLVSTNVTARGIDVEQVTMVVNFDMPDHLNENTGRIEADCETYLHRIGRTGRFGKQGIAINMIASDNDKRILRRVEEHFGVRVQPLDPHDVDDMDAKLDQN